MLQKVVDSYSCELLLKKVQLVVFCHFFFDMGFLSRTFMIHMTAGERGGYLFNSFLLRPPVLQTLRRFIVINEICHILRNRLRQGPKFCK